MATTCTKEFRQPVANDMGINIGPQDPENPKDVEAAAETNLDINTYLKAFAIPAEEGDADGCINCERKLGGLFGSFQWGIVHGHGKCGNCGWPAKAYHNPPSSDESSGGQGLFEQALSHPLCFHPEFVERKSDAQQDDA